MTGTLAVESRRRRGDRDPGSGAEEKWMVSVVF